MAYDYDALYATTPDALGAPTARVMGFFDRFGQTPVRVLDIGCGQGRNSLALARRGHSVVGIDTAPSGIAAMTDRAAAEGLDVTGIVADLAGFEPPGNFDVLLADRTLHMLDAGPRHEVVSRLLRHVVPKGWFVLLDEAPNVPGILLRLADHEGAWQVTDRKGGTLVAHRNR